MPKIKKKDPYAQQVQSAVRQRYRPQRQEIAGQLRASRQQDKNIHDWYQGYLNEVHGAEASTAGGYTDAAGRIGQAADTSSATDRSNRQQMIAELQADAAKRGATVDPNVDQTGAQAEAARRTGLDEALAATVRTGANQHAYLADKGRIGAGAEIGAHEAEHGRRVVLKQKRQQLKLDAADYGQSVRSSLVSAKANQKLAEATLGLKAGDLSRKAASDAEKARHDQILEGIKSGELDLKGKKFRSDRQKNRYQQLHHLGPYAPRAGAGPTPSELRHKRDSAQNNLSKAGALLSASPASSQHSSSQLVGYLVGKGIPADIARAAYQIHVLGGVKPGLRRHLRHKYGIKPRRANAPRVGQGVAGGNQAVGGIQDPIKTALGIK